jgi:hypothetical protein
MNAYVYFWYCIAESFLDWEMFETTVVEKVKTHFMFNKSTPPPRRPQKRAVFYKMWKKKVETLRQ